MIQLFVTSNYVGVTKLPARCLMNDAVPIDSLADGFSAIELIRVDTDWELILIDLKQQFADQTSGLVGNYFIQSSCITVKVLFVTADLTAQVTADEVVGDTMSMDFISVDSANSIGTITQLLGDGLEVCGDMVCCIGDVIGAIVGCLGD